MKTLVLNTVNKNLSLKLGGAVATNQLDRTTHYADNNGTIFIENCSDGVTNGATEVIIVSAPASSVRRVVKDISVCNTDTIAQDIYIYYNSSANKRQIFKKTLDIGETFTLDVGVASGVAPVTTHSVIFDVLDEGGSPLPGATVTLDLIPNSPGNYIFSKVAGTYTYSVSRSGYVTQTGNVVVSGNTLATINMAPTSGNTVKFVIVDDIYGLPVTNAIVTLDGATNTAGNYYFVKPNGSYSFSITKTGFDPYSGTSTVSGYTTNNVTLVTYIPPTFDVTFSLNTASLATISDYVIKFDGVFYPANQNVITGVVNGTYNYMITDAGHSNDYGSGTATVLNAPLAKNVTITADTYIDSPTTPPIANSTPITMTSYVTGGTTLGTTWSTGDATPSITKSPNADIVYACTNTLVGGLRLSNTFPVTIIYDLVFNLSTTLGAIVSDYCIELNGTFYPLNQNSFIGIPAGVYNYMITDAGHTANYGSGTVNITINDVTENVVITSVDLNVTCVPTTPIASGDPATLTANVTGGTHTYLWTVNSQTTAAITENPIVTTTYPCVITFTSGLKLTDNFEVVVIMLNPFVTEWTVSGDVTARTITLPLSSGNSSLFNCVVDRGDGTPTSTITSATDTDRIHTYASNGVYNVSITGQCQGWSFNNTGDKLKITKVVSFGDMTFKYLAYGFYGCQNLTSIGVDPIKSSGTSLISFQSTFGGCAITTIPTDLFRYVTQAQYFQATFAGCTSLTTIPTDLFRYNTQVSSFNLAFMGCTSLTTIPATLFTYNTIASTFNQTFSDCSSLATIPTDLFRYNTGVWDFGYVFNNCTSITTIPTDLFRYNTLVASFNIAFNGCTSLTTIPTDLFRYNTGVTSFIGTFSNCSLLSTIPTDLFRYNTGVQTFQAVLAGCALTTIPATLFMYNTAVTSFNTVFSACTSLTTIPTDLFRYNIQAGDFTNAFSNCTSLTTIPATLFMYNTGASFGYVFSSCMSLTTIPTDLFRYNTDSLVFGYAFYNCQSLTTIPTGLFKYNTAAISFGYAFYNCPKLQLNQYIFYTAGEQSTRFLNKSPNFTECFERPSFTGTIGVAPDLWSCSYGTGAPTTTRCYGGVGNSITSISNYASIPAGYK